MSLKGTDVGFNMADKRMISACLDVCMVSYAVPARTNGEIVVMVMDDGALLF